MSTASGFFTVNTGGITTAGWTTPIVDWATYPGTSTATATSLPLGIKYYQSPIDLGLTKIRPGAGEIDLPDGAKLIVDDAGNYRIEDADAKVTYQANRFREFSPFLNASEMLARFVEYVQKVGVKQPDVLGLPIELFINWLVIEAAERDQDPVPDGVVRVEDHQAVVATRKPKCLSCGRFIPLEHHRRRFAFCSIEHGIVYARSKLPSIAARSSELPALEDSHANPNSVV